MDKEFKIRSISLQLLTHVYLHCDTELRVKDLECESLLNADITEKDITKAYRYLTKSKYIIEKGVVAYKTITCELTAEGIDWVEENNNITLSIL